MDDFERICKEKYIKNARSMEESHDWKRRSDEELNKLAEESFDEYVNCGAYAFKVYTFVTPRETEEPEKRISKTVSGLLDTFPFVRLLGDTKLEDDEYLVIYKAKNHFIRVDPDGTVREKQGETRPKIFDSWGDYEDSETILFAVKRDHKMFDYGNPYEIIYKIDEGLDFDETILDAIQNNKTTFLYHSKKYECVKEGDEVFIIDNISGDRVADIKISENGTTIINTDEEKLTDIENFHGSMMPIIINGKMINLDEFQENSKQTQTKIITAETAVKSALEVTSTAKADEAKGTEDSELNPKNIKEGETKDD